MCSLLYICWHQIDFSTNSHFDIFADNLCDICIFEPPKCYYVVAGGGGGGGGGGACVPRTTKRLYQLESRLLAVLAMLDRLFGRGQTKCNTPLMLATSVYGLICRWPCYVLAQRQSKLDIPWPNAAEYKSQVWCHLSCWYSLLFDVESLACCVCGEVCSHADVLNVSPLPATDERKWAGLEKSGYESE